MTTHAVTLTSVESTYMSLQQQQQYIFELNVVVRSGGLRSKAALQLPSQNLNGERARQSVLHDMSRSWPGRIAAFMFFHLYSRSYRPPPSVRPPRERFVKGHAFSSSLCVCVCDHDTLLSYPSSSLTNWIVRRRSCLFFLVVVVVIAVCHHRCAI